jgi:hypothetical protein
MAQLLQAGKFQDLDIENLAEEVKALGRSEKRAVRGNGRFTGASTQVALSAWFSV